MWCERKQIVNYRNSLIFCWRVCLATASFLFVWHNNFFSHINLSSFFPQQIKIESKIDNLKLLPLNPINHSLLKLLVKKTFFFPKKLKVMKEILYVAKKIIFSNINLDSIQTTVPQSCEKRWFCRKLTVVLFQLSFWWHN